MLRSAPQLPLRLETPPGSPLEVAWPNSLRVAGLFAGIGGIERGLHQAGHQTELLCEIEPAASMVLERHFGLTPHGNVGDLTASVVPEIDLLAGGFPCQDLSQAGRTKGIGGSRSGLVDHMVRLLEELCPTPTWVLFENVPFMLQLDGGQAMAYLTETLANLGWVWAYRVVDTRAFGLPQRRKRVIFLASKSCDPRHVLFADEAGPREFSEDGVAYGFYWTEGRRGLGWGVDAVPPLKGGSSIGIPSPPAIWMPDGSIVTPDIRDAERLQGFPVGWTKHEGPTARKTLAARWKMVGNAVSVPVAKWVGRRLKHPKKPNFDERPIAKGRRWPSAGWGYGSEAFAVDLSNWPVHHSYKHLAEFLKYPTVPLSLRATAGFRLRTDAAKLNFEPGFLDALDVHIERMRATAAK
ncbi:putative BsuMI modification methylase subunit YdiP [Enhygromyxa salina]|uniref:Cytosine-specific methyltransferase n=1 Tax=Enhygromyxa salina TaxID=215803 RepID=A0A2S9XJU1_9BACT|nr:DNA (cytosine-5-)-methyltransferase [Enhygromyxa salina]PRP93146.1 putative BsuMI modification methylase subunit YdiP [Enhygromyxa salina]